MSKADILFYWTVTAAAIVIFSLITGYLDGRDEKLGSIAPQTQALVEAHQQYAGAQ